MHRRYNQFIIVAFIVGACFTNGCTMMEVLKENKAREQRIVIKEKQLEEIKTENQVLDEKKQELLSALENNRLSLDDLSMQLAEVRQENAKITAATENQKEDQAILDRQIKACQAKIEGINKSNLSHAEKEKKLKDLMEQRDLKKLMLMLANQPQPSY